MSEPTVVDVLGTGLLHRYPDEAAVILEAQRPEEVAAIVADLDASDAAGVLTHLSTEMAARTAGLLPPSALAPLAAHIEIVRLATWLAWLPAEELHPRLEAMPPGDAAAVREILTYPPDTAGREMDPRVTTFRPETTAEQALTRLRAVHEDEFEDVYLVDGDGVLVGSVPLEGLAIAQPDTALGSLELRRVAGVQATAPIDDVLEVFAQTRSGGVPVVDFHGRLLGVVRQADLIDAAEESASADLQTMVGVGRDERALSPVGFAVRKRLPWLHVNLLTAFLAAAVVGVFESTIARFSALAVLLPVVAGQSGNGGAQALAVTMRGLALREVRPADWRKMATKELGVAFANSVVIAVVTSLAVLAWSRTPGLALVIGIAMIISMTVAGVAGASVPVVLKRLGQDPAQSSSIVLTTVTDVVGFLSFLGLATAFSALLE